MDKESWIVVTYIFALTMFFSAMNWLNRRVKSEEYEEEKTTIKAKIELVTHSITASLIGVVLYAGLTHYFGEWSLLFRGVAAIACGAFLSEAILNFAKGRLKDG